ncbi:hypothetical protein SDC9_131497 [bioreactor metagenome]|uniref:Uncharacterized protein n=1 Tax=bioreactor metagenome TaxID=1076179 RepID=A0A645D5C9_9ZZZZ
MGPRTVFQQPRALAHAKTLLFVNDHSAEVFKFNLVGEQRLGAGNDADESFRQAVQRLFPLPRGQVGLYQRAFDAQRRKVSLRLPVKLLGEHLGRCEHRALRAAVTDSRRKRDGDERLAAADVSLQKA